MKLTSDYVIYSAYKSESMVYAAKKLKEYIFGTCSLDLPVKYEKGKKNLILGRMDLLDGKLSEFGEVKGDGFAFYPDGADVYIVALTERGIIYGVYGFIEKYLNVRFLSADFEYVPRLAEANLPTQPYISNPAIDMRTYLVGGVHDKKADFDHYSRSRTKDVFTNLPRTYGENVGVYGRNVNHNFHFYVPFEKYGNDHPEFYRPIYVNEEALFTIDLTNGITEDGKIDDSMDVSVAKIVLDEMKKDLHTYPDLRIINFTQEDGEYYFDDEHNRKLESKYKRSGILIRFCNAVIRELNKYAAETFGGRQVKMVTFAYAYTTDAPVVQTENGPEPIDETVVADKNLIIQMALFSNARYGYFSDKQYDFIKKSIAEWKIIASEFWFWAYDINFHKYLYFYDSFKNIQDNMEGFKNLNLSYMCMQGTHDARFNWQCNMRAYAYNKLMWGENSSAEELLDEYMRLSYGPAAPHVKEMIEIFERNYASFSDDDDLTFGIRGTCEDAKYNPREMLLAALGAIEKGERAIKDANMSEQDRDGYLRRLAQVKCTPLIHLYDLFFYHRPNASWEEYAALKNEFFGTARYGGVDVVGERWTLDQYEKEGGVSEHVYFERLSKADKEMSIA